jgi:Cys-rich four helix bundle protein (predicted Tat secretion target)
VRASVPRKEATVSQTILDRRSMIFAGLGAVVGGVTACAQVSAQGSGPAAGPPGAPPPGGGHHHGHDASPAAPPSPALQAVIDATAGCARDGRVCLARCTDHLAAGMVAMEHCQRGVMNMLAVVSAMADVAGFRNASPQNMKALAAACAAFCKACAEACAPHAAHHAECKACMDSCLACAKACEAFAAA